jgi:hypothetical protein
MTPQQIVDGFNPKQSTKTIFYAPNTPGKTVLTAKEIALTLMPRREDRLRFRKGIMLLQRPARPSARHIVLGCTVEIDSQLLEPSINGYLEMFPQ